ncbi:MAG: VWA domain-containing protein, partial [Allobranchiibius sp.]
DGWERGDAADLGQQMQRLSRLAHRVVWVNPHRGKAGYQPVQTGIVAVLPHCDDFVAGHSLQSFEKVLEVVGNA